MSWRNDLPEKPMWCLVTLRPSTGRGARESKPVVKLGWFKQGAEPPWRNELMRPFQGTVTHWMPLPEPAR